MQRPDVQLFGFSDYTQQTLSARLQGAHILSNHDSRLVAPPQTIVFVSAPEQDAYAHLPDLPCVPHAVVWIRRCEEAPPYTNHYFFRPLSEWLDSDEERLCAMTTCCHYALLEFKIESHIELSDKELDHLASCDICTTLQHLRHFA